MDADTGERLKVRVQFTDDAGNAERLTSGPATDPVAVDYRTLDTSAKAGQDYEARKGTLTFGAGETDKTLRVTVLDDAVDEGDEKMVVVLQRADGAVRGDYLAVGTIEDSDGDD